ncbi:lanthionine synthetase C family protein [Fodinicola acaciae]|uniref:lanthionine synthetase C family protein n=1 Tax=Fodinicola acaciae TaxID=2681555 RepID=UPI0013D72EC2|nr:lanthionine synthetase C family protein [Fodinicola acaciae]
MTDIVAEVAERLADPAAVRHLAETAETAGRWDDLSLAAGHPGIAVFFAELAATDAQWRPALHAWLTACAPHVAGRVPRGLYEGPAAMAFATRMAHIATGSYGRSLERLDTLMARSFTVRLRSEWPGEVRVGDYDVVNGITGALRYLLLAGQTDAVAEGVTALVSLAGPYDRRPGWWVAEAPGRQDPAGFPDGHANLGLAHGISGPLAMLAMAVEAGIVVDGQDAAIVRIVEWLLENLHDDHWPPFIRRPAERIDRRERASWCYGTPGIARALWLAGRALRRPQWTVVAERAIDAVCALPTGLSDPGLCHGWAGLAHILSLFPVTQARAAAYERAIAEIVARFEPDTVFGFRHTGYAGQLDNPGLLDGAAGAALVLQTYATGQPATPWDAAFILG